MNRIKTFWMKNKIAVLIGVAVLLIAGTIITITLIFQNSGGYNNYNSEQLQQTVEDETGKLTTEISEKTELPTDETPILSTVSDKSLLTDEIFKDAENGDKVLIYEKAGIMVIYRESTKEIIATGRVASGPAEEENIVPTGVEE